MYRDGLGICTPGRDGRVAHQYGSPNVAGGVSGGRSAIMPATTPMLMTAARKSAERRICVCIAVVPLCSSPLTNTADIPIGILSFFRHKYENSFFGIGNNKKSPPLFFNFYPFFISHFIV